VGVVGRLLHLFEAGIIKRVCTVVNWMVRGVIFNVSAFALPAAVGTLVRWMDPDFWFTQLDLEAFEVDPMALCKTETLSVMMFLIWVRWLIGKAPRGASTEVGMAAVRFPKPRDEVVVALAWAGLVISLWAPRGSAVLFGLSTLGA
jgi:hypothetical protein